MVQPVGRVRKLILESVQMLQGVRRADLSLAGRGITATKVDAQKMPIWANASGSAFNHLVTLGRVSVAEGKPSASCDGAHELQ